MAKKAKDRSEIKARDDATRRQRRTEAAATQEELAREHARESAQIKGAGGAPSAERARTEVAAQEELRQAAGASQQRAHAESFRPERSEVPLGDDNPPPDRSVHEMNTGDLHPAVTTPQGTQADSIGDAHELRDASARTLSVWFGSLFIVIIVAAGLMVLLFQFFLRRGAHLEKPTSPLMAEQTEEARPRPLLPMPELPLEQFNQHQQKFVTEYTRDQDTGQLRIPVERAMELIAERGLPSAPVPESQPVPAHGGSGFAGYTPGEPQEKSSARWRNPADYVLPTNLGVGKNNPNASFRIPIHGMDFPAGHLEEMPIAGAEPKGEVPLHGEE